MIESGIAIPLIDAAARGLLWSAAGLLLCGMAVSWPARWRARLSTTLLLALAWLPLLFWFGPRWTLAWPGAEWAVAQASSGGAGGFSWLGAAVWVWGAGALLFLLRTGLALRVLARWERRFPECPALTARARRLAGLPGLGLRDVRVLVGAGQDRPLVWGLRRTIILLPAPVAAWAPERLDWVLRHELLHAARRDPLLCLLAELTLALHWANPLAWWLRRRMAEDREQAIDEALAAPGRRERGDYAAALLEVALLGRSGSHPPPAPAMAMGASPSGGRELPGSASPLRLRIARILGEASEPAPPRWLSALAMSAGLLALAGCLFLGLSRQTPGDPERKASALGEEAARRLAAEPFPAER